MLRIECDFNQCSLTKLFVIDRPTAVQTHAPTNQPSTDPTASPSITTTGNPSIGSPTEIPTASPSFNPTHSPTSSPIACADYNECIECISVPTEHQVGHRRQCKWLSDGNQCCNVWTEDCFNNTVPDHLISEKEQCPVQTQSPLDNGHIDDLNWVYIAAVSVALLFITCIIFLCLKYKWYGNNGINKKNMAEHVEGASSLTEIVMNQREGHDERESVAIDDAQWSDDGDMTATERGRFSTAASMISKRTKKSSATSRFEEPISILIQRAAKYGKIWRPNVVSPQMIQQWIDYMVPNSMRIIQVLREGHREYVCGDVECQWNVHHENEALFPHQVVHGIIYHSEGTSIRGSTPYFPSIFPAKCVNIYFNLRIQSTGRQCTSID